MAVDAVFSDVKVLDLSRFAPGAYCTVLLADMGADVVRIDAPGRDTRMYGNGTAIARGKKSVAIDLREAEGQDLLRRLVAWADVVVDNARPGSLDERGYGPTAAREEHPDLIWCSVTGFGQDGPYAQWPGHDLTYTAHSGLLHGINPNLPWHPQVIVSIPIGSMMAVIGISGALYERARTGTGAFIDISITESSTWMLGGAEGHLTDSSWGIPAGATRRLYRCSDGKFVNTAADEPRTWRALCEGLGLDDLADIRPADLDHDEAIERISASFATRPAVEWVTHLGALGAAVSIVNEGAMLLDDPHLVARGSVVDIAGTPVPRNPVRIARDGQALTGMATTPPATPGQHSREVLAGVGLSDAEIDALVDAGVVDLG